MQYIPLTGGGAMRRMVLRKVSAMTWETPSFIEINMSAEIGGYQSDFGDREPVGPAAPRQGHSAEPIETVATR